MTVGFDAKRLFHNTSGLGNYSRSLVYGINKYFPETDCVLFSPKAENSAFLNDFNSNKVVSKSGWSKSIWRSITQEKDWNENGIDVYHGLSHELPFRRKAKDVKRIVTIHDLIHKAFPADHKWHDRWSYERKIQNALDKADLIVCVSEFTAKDLIQMFDVDNNKVRVVYQSVNHQFEIREKNQDKAHSIRAKYNLPSEYFLHVSSLRPRKNLLGIIEAMHLLDSNDLLPLVVIGQGKDYKKLLLSKIQEYGLAPYIHFIHADWKELKYLYDLALFSIYPSFYEGFGIPVIESQFRDCPVIASDRTSVPEAGGDAAYYVNPASPESISMAIKKLSGDSKLRNDLINKGKTHRNKFKLQSFARNMMNVYDEVLVSV